MSHLKYAVAAALMAVAAGSAQALDISAYDSTVVNVYIGGSTATDNTILNTSIPAASAGLCNTSGIPTATGPNPINTVDQYTVVDVNGTVTNRMIFCNASGNAGITAGTKLAIYKESNGGSANGVLPLIAQKKGLANGLVFIDANALKAGIAAATTTCTNSLVAATTSGKLGAYTQHNACTGGTLTAAATITGGVADVEGPLLAPPPTAGDLALLTAKPGLQVVWGVPVTKVFYYALQHAEHLDDGTVIATCNTANNDAPACAPTLTKSQVTGIYNGNIIDAAQLITPAGTPLAAAGAQSIYVCRRDNGSGTEASFEYYYLGARCSISDLGMATSAGANAGYVLINNSTGSVRNCLKGANAGTAFTDANGVAAAWTAPSYAVGIMSTEVKSGDLSGAGDSFRFVKVNNALPTLDNTVNGRWDHFSESVLYTISGVTGDPVTVFNKFQGLLAAPAFIAESNSAYSGRPWGSGGDLTPPTNPGATTPTIPATALSVSTNPTNTQSKSIGNPNGTPNNCDPPQQVSSYGTLTSPN